MERASTQEPYDEKMYIPRSSEEQRCLRAIRQSPKSALVTLVGPRGHGKTWLLHHIVNLLKEELPLANYVWMDLGALIQKDQSTHAFFRQLALRLVEPFPQAEQILASHYFDDLTPTKSFQNLLRDILKLYTKEKYFLIIDRADAALGQAYQNDFYPLLRSCLERREPAWAKLRLLMATSYPSIFLSTQLQGSPFNIGELVEITCFTQEQTLEMANRLGCRVSALELQQVDRLLGGHPALVHRCLRQAVSQHTALLEFCKDQQLQRQVFADYLADHRRRLHGEPALSQALRDVSVNPRARLSLETRAHLYSMGLVDLRGETTKLRRDLDLALMA